MAFYRFGSNTLMQFPTTPVSYVKTTLPYFVAANDSLVWFNEHYGNRIGVIDTTNNLLTEYSVSNPPATMRTQIGDALTFAVGKDKVWFTELSGNYIGYVDATYKPSFAVKPDNVSIKLTSGKKTVLTLHVEGESERNLTIISSVPQTPPTTYQSISANIDKMEIGTLNGQITLKVSVAASTARIPGRYEVLVSVSDGLVTEGFYLNLTVE
jgi:hypothetical protein